MSDELRAAAQRVTGYVRAWQLLSNTDNERLGEVTIMLNGWQDPAGPQTFELLAADLEALALHALGGTPTEDPTPLPFRCRELVLSIHSSLDQLVPRRVVCGTPLHTDGACPRREDHVR
jgi:hypothetical protein